MEELYFFRRFEDVLQLIAKVKASQDPGDMDTDLQKTLRNYETRCHQRLNRDGNGRVAGGN